MDTAFKQRWSSWLPSGLNPNYACSDILRLGACLAREDFKFDEEHTVLVENYICDPLGAIENPQECQGETFEHRCVSPSLEICLNLSASINNNTPAERRSALSCWLRTFALNLLHRKRLIQFCSLQFTVWKNLTECFASRNFFSLQLQTLCNSLILSVESHYNGTQLTLTLIVALRYILYLYYQFMKTYTVVMMMNDS